MHTHLSRPSIWFTGLLACLALSLAAPPADARSDLNRSINLAAGQWLLVEQMTNGAMLAALGIDADQNIRGVREARDQFSRTLRGLRYGDHELGLVRASQEEILDALARVEAVWPRYDQQIQTIIVSLHGPGGIDEAQIGNLSVLHAQMTEALDPAIAVFREYSYGGDTHSILTTTLNGSVDLRSRTQLILRELLAIAHRQDEEQNRRQLSRDAQDFHRTLSGLIHGDLERRLLPAATDEIRAELAKVQQLWAEIEPILAGIAAGGAVDQRSIATVSRHTDRMIGPLTQTSLMYENL